MKQYLQIGKIVGTHGIRGELRLEPWCDSPDFIKNFKTLYLDEWGNKAVMVQSKPHGNIVILRIDGVDAVEQAAAMRGTVLWMDRRDAPISEGTYYIEDLIGCRVLDVDNGKEYGMLSDVSKTGANDVWHIKDASGKEVLIPAIKDVVMRVDAEQKIVTIRPLRGIFEDED